MYHVASLKRSGCAAGLRAGRAPDTGAAASKAAKPKKRGRKPLDDNDTIHAADIVSSDDDFADHIMYEYQGQGVSTAANDTSGRADSTPAASEGDAAAGAGDDEGTEKDDGDAYEPGGDDESEAVVDDEDDDDDFDDFVG